MGFVWDKRRNGHSFLTKKGYGSTPRGALQRRGCGCIFPTLPGSPSKSHGRISCHSRVRHLEERMRRTLDRSLRSAEDLPYGQRTSRQASDCKMFHCLTGLPIGREVELRRNGKTLGISREGERKSNRKAILWTFSGLTCLVFQFVGSLSPMLGEPTLKLYGMREAF
ncbi:hypothetical protein GE09DRAFT_92477 [Coniochaeta sp. 2T2.1]|nr:hypothetical protein GE09DRAFT_92477 [Coniochaeta sp. 2T2.1]